MTNTILKKHFTIKNLFFLLTLAIVIFFLGKNLLPSNTMFQFHDETQGARVQEFTYNIQYGMIPPRIAPHFSFHLGYPVFNFYAPFSYWVTSSLHILGLDVADSLKMSFLLAVVVAFIGMYAFLRLYFRFAPSLLGAVLYVASPWLAAEIFVRGNLGEVWFWGLFPLALYAIYEMDEYKSPFIFATTVFILFCTLTVHNIFSLLFLPIAAVYMWIIGNKIKNYIGLLLALLLSSYFLLPVIAESTLTYAREVATQTKYNDHFLCVKQLWSAPFWGFGGSAPGCMNDGMAFMVGKTQIILGFIGIILFLVFVVYSLKKPPKKKNGHNFKIYSAVLFLTLISLFLTTEQSKLIWDFFKPVLSLFQFPWRFMFFIVFGLSFFSTYLANKIKHPAAVILITIIGLFVLISTSKYFYKTQIAKSEYNTQYLSDDYIRQSVAYKIPEYLPKTANYKIWRQFENSTLQTGTLIKGLDGKQSTTEQNEAFNKFGQTNSEKFLLNIHYMPYWKIRINNIVYIPDKFDTLGRPYVTALPGNKTIEIEYKQTHIEIVSNIITVMTFLILVVYMLSPIILSKKRNKKLSSLFRL